MKHDYAVKLSPVFSEFQNEVLMYIAGFIDEQLTEKLKYSSSIECLQQKKSPTDRHTAETVAEDRIMPRFCRPGMNTPNC